MTQESQQLVFFIENPRFDKFLLCRSVKVRWPTKRSEH